MPHLRACLGGALCALLLLAAPASAQSNPEIGAAPDTSTLRAIEGQVSQIRGLEALAEPDLQLLDHASLTTYLANQFERDYLPNERESDQKEFVLLGLIKPTDNIVQIQLNLLSDQVIGIYDSGTKSLFVVADQAGFGPAERMTYAHEFNHALQDQYYDLNKIAPKHPASNDRSLAVHALIEGDAIMLQTLWRRWWYAQSCCSRTSTASTLYARRIVRPAMTTLCSTICSRTRPSPRRSCCTLRNTATMSIR